jgi:ATP-dependent helicase/nuclease subunit A
MSSWRRETAVSERVEVTVTEIEDPPTDALARRDISGNLGETLFVEAGAGSGKTSELVGRIVSLVRAGKAEMRSIAAITFTEAAAAELRSRVRAELETAAAAAPGDERLECALDQLDEAAMTTIHGFANRILAERPLEAGLPPRFEVLDEVAGSIDFDASWSAFLDELLEERDFADVYVAGQVLGVEVDRLRSVALRLDEVFDRFAVGSSAAVVDEATSRLRDRVPLLADVVSQACDGALAFLSSCRNEGDKLRAEIDKVAQLRSDLAAACDDWAESLRCLKEAPKPRFTYGQAKLWVCDVDEVRAAVRFVVEATRAALAEAGALVSAAVLARLGVHAVKAAEDRAEAGRLRFHDLLVRCRDLLGDEDVRAALQVRWTHVLVDEFQDTDPIQLDIARQLAIGRDGEITPGRLFFVGDPKQSIYRFRHADIGLYAGAPERMRGRQLALTANFRSVPGILEWVNQVFGQLMPAENSVTLDGRVSQIRFKALDATRAAGPGRPPVTVVGGPVDERAEAIRARESCAVVEVIGRLLDDAWQVRPEPDGQPRDATYADVAILVPRRIVLGALEQALDDADIPYRVSSASLVFGTEEVRDLLSIARAVDAPADDVAVVAALRSPAFGCGDDDLVAYRDAGGHWDFTLDSPPPELPGSPVLAATDVLRRLHAERWRLGISGTLETIVRSRRLLQLGFGRRHPRDSWRRIRFVLDQARAFEEAGGASLSDFVAWVTRQADGSVRAVESTLPEDDEDAVRILTIHGAKGLEFPVTIVAGLGTGGDRPMPGPTLLFDGEQRPELALRAGVATAGFDTAKLVDVQEEQDEQIRLLYVAMTRARDFLVVSGFHNPVGQTAGSLAEKLWGVLGDEPFGEFEERLGTDGARATWVEPSLGQLSLFPDGGASAHRVANAGRRSTRPGAVVAATSAAARGARGARGSSGAGGGARSGARAGETPGGTLADYQAWLADRERRIGTARRSGSVAATSIPTLARAQADQPSPGTGQGLLPGAFDPAVGEVVLDAEGTDDLRPGQRGRAGTALGRAVHATLQLVDLADGHDLDAIAEVAAAAELISDRTADVRRLARAALDSPSVRAAVSSGKFHREVYVGAPVGGTLVEGYIDLLYEEEEGGLVVVDYKTDIVRDDEEVEQAFARYRLQGATYALALETALGRPVRRCVFVFLAMPHRTVERVVEDLRASMAEVGRVVEAVAAS